VLEIDQLMEKIRKLEEENSKMKQTLVEKERKEKEKGLNQYYDIHSYCRAPNKRGIGNIS